MVARACHHRTVGNWNAANAGWWFCSGPIHIHLVLMPDRGKAYEAILALVFGLAIACYLTKSQGLLLITTIFILLTLLSPWLAKRVAWLWFKFAEGLNFIMTRIILGLIFFIILSPLAFFQRLFGKNSLQLKKPTGSVYAERKHRFVAEDLEKPW